MTRIQVLLVDDSEGPREALAEALTKLGRFEVTQCTNSARALAELRTKPQFFGVVVTDWLLGKRNSGRNLVQSIRLLNLTLPIIVVTGLAPDAGPVALEAGATSYLPAPVDPGVLVAKIRQFVDQDQALRRVADTLRHLIGADACIVWRYDRRKRAFRVHAWDAVKDLDASDIDITLSAGAPATEKLFSDPDVLYVRTLQESDAYLHRPNARRHGWVSLISIPLVHLGRPIGLVDVYTCTPYGFGKGQKVPIKRMLTAFGQQVAESMHYSDLLRRAQTFDEINGVLSGYYDVDSILATIVTRGTQLAEADGGWLYVCESSDGNLRLSNEYDPAGAAAPKHIPLGSGIVGRVANTGQAESIDNSLPTDAGFGLPVEGMRSQLAVPLRHHEQTTGVLVVTSKVDDAFTFEDRDLLMSFARSAALAVHRAKVVAHLQKVSRSVLQTRESIAQSVVEAMYDLTGKPVSLWLLEGSTSELRVVAAKGMAADYASSPPIRLADNAIAPYVLLNGVEVNRGDLADSSQYPPFKNQGAAQAHKWRSGLFLPLRTSAGIPLGTLHIYSPSSGPFVSALVELARTFAELGARMIEQIQRVQVAAIAQQLSGATGLASTCDTILRGLQQVVPYRKATIQSVVGNDRRALVAKNGFSDAEINPTLLRPVRKDRLIQRLLKGQTCLVLSDCRKDPDWTPLAETKNVRSWIGIPLIYGPDVIGLMTLDYDQVGFYKKEMGTPLQEFAHLAATAMMKAQLREEAENRVRDLEIISELSTRMSTEVDEGELIATTLSAIRNRLNCSHCTLFAPIKGSDPKVLAVAQTTAAESARILDRSFRAGEGLAGWVYEHGATINTPDATEDQRFALARKSGGKPRPMLVVPVSVSNQTIGVISADRTGSPEFSRQDQSLLEVLASQIGVIVQRSRGLKSFHSITKSLLSTAGEESILPEIARCAIEITNSTYAAIHLVEWDGEHYAISRTYSEPPDLPTPRIADKEGVTYHIVTTRDMEYVLDTKLVSGVHPGLLGLGVRSFVGVPLKIGETVTGVLYVYDRDIHSFSQTETTLLSILASQAALATKYARIVNSQKKQADLLRALDSLSLDLAQKNDLIAILTELAESINGIMHADFTTVFSFDWEEQRFDDGRRFDVGRSHGGKLPQPSLPVKNELTFMIAHTRTAEFILDCRNDSRVNQNWCAKSGAVSCAAIPIQYTGNLAGVLYVNYRQPHEFTNPERDLLRALASQAAVAIQSARRYRDFVEKQKERIWGELGRTAASVAHRVGNKGGLIRVCLGDLSRRLTELQVVDPDVVDSLDVIKRSNLLLLDMSSELLKPLEVAAAGSTVQLDLSVVVADAKVLAEVPASVVVNVGSGILSCPKVKASKGLVEVFLELFGNARRAMETVPVKRIDIDCESSGRTVVVTFTDTGTGLSPEARRSVFALFQHSTQTDGTGAVHRGFGLWWVKTYLQSINGSISCSGSEGNGTTFRIELQGEQADGR